MYCFCDELRNKVCLVSVGVKKSLYRHIKRYHQGIGQLLRKYVEMGSKLDLTVFATNTIQQWYRRRQVEKKEEEMAGDAIGNSKYVKWVSSFYHSFDTNRDELYKYYNDHSKLFTRGKLFKGARSVRVLTCLKTP